MQYKPPVGIGMVFVEVVKYNISFRFYEAQIRRSIVIKTDINHLTDTCFSRDNSFCVAITSVAIGFNDLKCHNMLLLVDDMMQYSSNTNNSTSRPGEHIQCI